MPSFRVVINNNVSHKLGRLGSISLKMIEKNMVKANLVLFLVFSISDVWLLLLRVETRVSNRP